MIYVDNLSKTFTYYEKETGVKGSIRNLFKRTQLEKEAVQSISFEINTGEIVAFIGPNGAGKTTTLKMLSGVLYPTGGNASVLGYVPWERKKNFKMRFSLVMGQKAQLLWDLPAMDSLQMNKLIYEIEDESFNRTVGELSELLDVKHLLKIQVRRLSLGERMKFELIAALVHRPQVLFLDEPTIGLDLVSQMNIRNFLKQYNRQTGATILLTSHYMKDIEDLCKRAILINHGKIVYDDALANLNRFIGNKMVVTFGKINLSEQQLQDLLGREVAIEDGKHKIIADEAELNAVFAPLLAHLPMNEIHTDELSLEDGIALLYKQ